MKIGVLGTGGVGQTIAAKLLEQGHEVTVGTRDPKATLAKTEPDGMGAPPYKDFAASHPKAKLATFQEAAAGAEFLFNATSGHAAMDALKAAGAAALDGKVLVDISNPLDFSKGFPPSLFVCNTDSLAEQLQKAFPGVKLVKTLNTLSAPVMVNPMAVANGEHALFLSGNDAAAKAKVTELLKTWGWKHLIDLGDVTTARGTEMLLPAWVRLFGTLNTPMFNFHIAR